MVKMKHSKKRIQRGGAELVFNIPIKDIIKAQILVSPKEEKISASPSRKASRPKSKPKPAAAEEIVPEQPMITIFTPLHI